MLFRDIIFSAKNIWNAPNNFFDAAAGRKRIFRIHFIFSRMWETTMVALGGSGYNRRSNSRGKHGFFLVKKPGNAKWFFFSKLAYYNFISMLVSVTGCRKTKVFIFLKKTLFGNNLLSHHIFFKKNSFYRHVFRFDFHYGCYCGPGNDEYSK